MSNEGTNKRSLSKSKGKLKERYFYGIGTKIGEELNISAGYVQDV